MDRPPVWTPEQDELVRVSRAAGLSWDHIALLLPYSRQAIVRHAQRKRILVGRPTPGAPVQDAIDPRRAPLSAGDPVSWSAITAGTSMDGAPFKAPAG